MPLEQLKVQFDQCLAADAARFRAQCRALEKREAAGRPIDRGLAKLARQVDSSVAAVQRRRAGLPVPTYPQILPIVERRQDILALLEQNPVIVLCGETGSGKTTQLPKLCLELGRGTRGKIGHTQPRRIAARSLASRIADELDSAVGRQVGYKVRFHDRVRDDSYIKVMTDGILLAETQSDPDLLQYDTLIIDEAHERSLNIDFLLGYLRQLIDRRPDLKLIITSATIDPQRFSAHFSHAPVLEVSGRTYPVEIRYRPVRSEHEDQRDRDRGQALLDAVDELAGIGPGDVLVFLPGERDIREAAELLRKHHPPQTEILPLYAKLSVEQQGRVFRQHRGRRIVLATNVAETSLTVPGIHYVVDTGLARVSRYSYRTKVQRLPVEAVSQASARQRSGRCGRVAAGVCIRLYDEADFEQRPEFTDPEIQRTNLAAVILQMAALKLGDVTRFPFIDPPDPRFVRDGYRLLQELAAVDSQNQLTATGRKLARLPVDPRIGRMLLEAHKLHSLKEVLIIAAALSIPDPRERPMEHAQAADEKQKIFRHPKSDFLGFIALWRHYQQQAKHLSQNKLRKWCREHFLSFTRLREWRDIHGQLLGLCTEMGFTLNEQEAGYEAIHRALLPGLLGNIACKGDELEYAGARNLKFHIFPGSVLAKKSPRWVMAAELVETGRRYLRTVASIEPGWVEAAAGELARRQYAEPYWAQRPARVMAYETVSLYGLPLVTRRRVHYGPIDPVVSRQLFIRHALVLGEYRCREAFFSHNLDLLQELSLLEAKSRRPDLLIDEQLLYDWFDERIPATVTSGAAFNRWWKQAQKKTPELLHLNRALLMQHDAAAITEAQYPDRLEIRGIQLPVRYQFTPGHEADGLGVDIPIAALNQFSGEDFEWLVPGLLHEKIIQLIRSLPKQWRRHFVPVPDYATACMQAIENPTGPLTGFLTRVLHKMTGIEVPADAWQPDKLSRHLYAWFCVLDEQGHCLDEGSDLERLQQKYRHRARKGFQQQGVQAFEAREVSEWDFEDLPPYVEMKADGVSMRGYPALAVVNDRPVLRLFDNRDAARASHQGGLLKLLACHERRTLKTVRRGILDLDKQCLWYAPLGSCESLADDIMCAVLTQAFLPGGKTIRSQTDFLAALDAGRPRLVEIANNTGMASARALEQFHLLSKQLNARMPPTMLEVAHDIRQQLERLIYPGFVSRTPAVWLPHLSRYIRSACIRLEKYPSHPPRDRQLSGIIQKFQARYEKAIKKSPGSDGLQEFRWHIEELRVSLFSQELKTSVKVSEQRLERMWQSL